MRSRAFLGAVLLGLMTFVPGLAGAGPVISVSPTSHDFGRVNVGSGSPTFDFTISNIGDATLIITLPLTQSSPGFTATVTTTNLPPGTSTLLHTSYVPFGSGPQFDNVTIMSNASNGDATVLLQGIANNPPVCDPPLASSYSLSAFIAFSLVASATDSEGDVIIRSISPLPVGATFDTASGILNWTPNCSDAGDYSVTITQSDGLANTNCPFILHVACPLGSLTGTVQASCPPAATQGLLGVTVDAYAAGSGVLVASTPTNGSGNYSFPSLPAGDYVITVVTPLGYVAAATEVPVTVPAGGTVSVNFSLTCIQVASDPRTIGYWKHQAGVALGGNGNPQVDTATLCTYLDRIEAHFNNNALNQVLIYQPPSSATCEQKVEAAGDLLNLTGSVAMIDRARQQLMALLLNVAANYIAQTAVISKDGATVSQAITYCDNLIDTPGGDVEKAKTIADIINNGGKVPAGMIPLGTSKIAYAPRVGGPSLRVSSNPGRGEWTFQFSMAARGSVTLRVYDLSGRLVATVLRGELGQGSQTLRWDGRADGGKRVANGLYLARLSTPLGAETIKLLQLRP